MSYERSFLPTYKSQKLSVLLIALILGVYSLQYTSIASSLDNFLLDYVFIPAIWLGAILLVYFTRNLKAEVQTRKLKDIWQWTLIFACVNIVIMIFAGIVFGFGKSPYDRSAYALLMHIPGVFIPMIGREFARSYLVNSLKSKKKAIYVVFIIFLLTLTNMSFNRFTGITSLISGLELLGSHLGPELANNIFATYLVYLGGPIASIVYLGFTQVVHFITPYLPNLTWIISALVGVLLPISFMMILSSLNNSMSKRVKEYQKESPIGWILTSIISILIIWFSLGVFSIYPSVIVTGSMEPRIKPGDIILVKRITDMEGVAGLGVDDVIQFRRDDILISHRIVEIQNNDETLEFITKGDNNPSIDKQRVKPEDIKGIVDQVVPKVGLPTLFLRSQDY